MKDRYTGEHQNDCAAVALKPSLLHGSRSNAPATACLQALNTDCWHHSINEGLGWHGKKAAAGNEGFPFTRHALTNLLCLSVSPERHRWQGSAVLAYSHCSDGSPKASCSLLLAPQLISAMSATLLATTVWSGLLHYPRTHDEQQADSSSFCRSLADPFVRSIRVRLDLVPC